MPQTVTFHASEAVFDATAQYRYWLSREWDTTRPAVSFIMLNPSRADASRPDPTVTRCLHFAMQWGFGRLVVVNLFAWRSPYPAELVQCGDPVGPENDRYLLRGVEESAVCIAAWGNHGRLRDRQQSVLALLDQHPLMALALTKTGAPRHPLYAPRDAQIIPFHGPTEIPPRV